MVAIFVQLCSVENSLLPSRLAASTYFFPIISDCSDVFETELTCNKSLFGGGFRESLKKGVNFYDLTVSTT